MLGSIGRPREAARAARAAIFVSGGSGGGGRHGSSVLGWLAIPLANCGKA